MISKTFYCYDDTFDAFENAKDHVHKYLLDKGYETDKTLYCTTNEHPAGYDCICVEVFSDEILNVSSFTGNTIESENNKGDHWVCPNMLLQVANHKFYHGGMYFDGDRLCGVKPAISEPKPKKREKRV